MKVLKIFARGHITLFALFVRQSDSKIDVQAPVLIVDSLGKEHEVADPVKIVIRAVESAGVDAPTPEDLLGQVQDLVDILRGVERCLSDGTQSVDWRITKATSNSPISFEITPFPLDGAMNIDRRVKEVEAAASDGLKDMALGIQRPPYFTEEVLPKAERMHARVLNGLANTVVEFPDTISGEPIIIDPKASRVRTKLLEVLDKKIPVRSRELGSIEGYVAKVERDGRGASVLYVRDRLTGVIVKVTGKGAAFDQLNYVNLGTIWRGLRVRLYGIMTYEDVGKIKTFGANNIRILDQKNLPSPDDLIDPELTDGLSSEEFLESIRRG